MTGTINMLIRTDNETVVNQCMEVVRIMRDLNGGHVSFSASFGGNVVVPKEEYDLLQVMALKERGKHLDRLKEESSGTHSSETETPSEEQSQQT